MSSPSLTPILSALVDVAKRGGAMILSAHPPPSTSATGTKKNSADLVTETDQAVEKMISTTLMAKYPTFKFLGEETYKPGMKLGPEPTFVVDPIDGTTNFVHGHPYVSVSAGFAVDKQPKVGVVFNPFTGIMYTAVEGQGAYRQVYDYRKGATTATTNGESTDGAKPTTSEDVDGEWSPRSGDPPVKLPLREPTPFDSGLAGTMVAVEWGSDRTGSNWQTKIKTWDNLGRSKEEGGAMVHSARCLGSAALNLCAVAEGHVDAYWEGGCWAWDVCAGWVILKEAGGIIVDGNPTGNYDIPVDNRKYLAVRGAKGGQKELIEEFWSHVVGEMDYES